MVRASKNTTRESLHLLLRRMRNENEALQHLIDALTEQNKNHEPVVRRICYPVDPSRPGAAGDDRTAAKGDRGTEGGAIDLSICR